jgi:hypothetical protein
MKTILVINDDYHGAINASKFAFLIAQKLHANVLLANLIRPGKIVKGLVSVNCDDEYVANLTGKDLGEYLRNLNDRPNDFEPAITEIDASAMTENELAQFINGENIWMVVKGISDVLPLNLVKSNLNINRVLNKIRCPIMLVPENWELKNIERLTYLTDLRYCRLQIVRYLIGIATPNHASVSVAHLSAQGIPEMDGDYANSFFNSQVNNLVNYNQLLFNNVHEKNLTEAADVLINGLGNDILAMVNNSYHVEEIAGKYLNKSLSNMVDVPLLIFPY